MGAERQRIIDEGARLLREINQMFLDVAHWNQIHPDEVPIDPDPDGRMAKLRHGLETMLSRGGK